MNIATNSLIGKDQSKAQFYLPFSFMITAFLALFIFSIFMIVGGALFSNGVIRSPIGIGASHLFILGFATMLAMGAVYQLVPVVINEKLYSPKLGVIHYFLYSVGVTGLLIAFLQFNLIVLIGSSILAVSGVIIFILNIYLTIRKATRFNSILFATVSSFFYLLLTVVTGLLLGLNFSFSILPTQHSALLATHIWFGLIGWFLFLIVGYSFKMLPMFYLSHGHSTKLQKWILIIFHISLLLLTTNFFLQIDFYVTLFALVLFLFGLSVYRYHIYEIQKKKFKKNPGKGILITVYAVDGLIVAVVVAICALIANPFLFQALHFLTAFTVLFVFGWVGITILGYLSKIVPFLWWTFVFGDRVGKENVPSLHNMINEDKVFRRLLFFAISVLFLSVSIAFQIPLLLFIAQICVGIFTIYFFVHILAVFSYS